MDLVWGFAPTVMILNDRRRSLTATTDHRGRRGYASAAKFRLSLYPGPLRIRLGY